MWYREGRIDVWQIPWRRARDFLGHSDLHRGPATWNQVYFAFNPQAPPFDDVNVRLALNYAVNRGEFPVDTSFILPTTTIVPPSLSDYQVEGYTYNPDRARELLAASKYGSDLGSYPVLRLIREQGIAYGGTRGQAMDDIADLGLPISWENVDLEFSQYITRYRVGAYPHGRLWLVG